MDRSYEAIIQNPLSSISPPSEELVELRSLVAYNQTKRCILGAKVACGDFSLASLAERMPQLTPQSGRGLLMDPFRGIPSTDVRVPLDLIYLDAGLKVIEIVELFPTYRVSPSSPPAASVLALPTHTIFSSQTQAGDQVAFGLAEEMKRELARLNDSSATAPAAQEELETRKEAEASVVAAPQPVVDDSASNVAGTQPWKKKVSKPKNWLLRLLFPDPEPADPRQAQRVALPGLTAYFWTGGTPLPHEIRNISATGLYVVTEERWYPGTLVRMALKKAGNGEAGTEASITMLVQVNRWGNDGVGLEYVMRDPNKPRDTAGQNDGVDLEELSQFFAQIRPKKG
jgi:hypothetical protein